MRRTQIRWFPFLLVLAYLSIVAARSVAFPNEDEVKQHLRPGMNVEETVTALGEPTITRTPGCPDCDLQYYAPVNTCLIPEEGYRGVVVHFKDGKVRDWRMVRTNPSYDPKSGEMPAALKWWLPWYLWLLGGLIALSALLGFLLRHAPATLLSLDEILAAYAARDIGLGPLPDEFQFINHETTLEEVIARLGPPSRSFKLPVDPSSTVGHGFLRTRWGLPAIQTFEYNLPYFAAVVVMPEYPFTPADKIRAVHYRRLRRELAEATGT